MRWVLDLDRWRSLLSINNDINEWLDSGKIAVSIVHVVLLHWREGWLFVDTLQSTFDQLLINWFLDKISWLFIWYNSSTIERIIFNVWELYDELDNWSWQWLVCLDSVQHDLLLLKDEYFFMILEEKNFEKTQKYSNILYLSIFRICPYINPKTNYV